MTAGERPPVRTFKARRGRLGATGRQALAEDVPALSPPPGPLLRRPGRQLVLEVGCGWGDAALAFAAAHPGLDLVAADVHTPGVAALARKARGLALANVAVVLGDAVELLEDRVPPGGLDAVHAFVPDPWPKRSQRHRRLVRPDVAALLHDRLAPGGRLLLATDDAGYAAAAPGVLAAAGFHVAVAARPPWRPLAGFEAKAVSAGHRVHDLLATRR